MSPDELNTVAAVFAALVGGVFGLSGLIVGIVGLVHSRKAQAAATQANDIARAANELAAAANTLSLAQVSRETERTDVAWEWRWDDTTHSDLVFVQNIGKSKAIDVVAQFFFDGAVEANTVPMEIAGRAEMRLEIPTLGERRRIAAEVELRSAAAAIARGTAESRSPSQLTSAQVRLRVSWVTPRGAPNVFDTNYVLTPLLRNGQRF